MLQTYSNPLFRKLEAAFSSSFTDRRQTKSTSELKNLSAIYQNISEDGEYWEKSATPQVIKWAGAIIPGWGFVVVNSNQLSSISLEAFTVIQK
ncbi:hypothetical protein NG798_17105 [Ancylothrix sp. C2]|uniref:hypothetical protein n=1 Tax=Ancylothrix sp. D3o TaxID=2953691 RepID=UPI0021BA8030|nr:hypothetical protein [Ancylothrix sp. D3o]MCT7951524.1 hypothetical protein [Ancylothrix sp. D3o]